MIKSFIFGVNKIQMRKPQFALFLLASMLCLMLQAQYTEVINTYRPGTSQGAFSVGKNVVQVETGIAFGKEEHNIFNNRTKSTEFEYNFRAGLVKEQLEFSIQGSYLNNRVTELIGRNEEEFVDKGFPFNALGAKYLIYDPYKYQREKPTNLKSWKANNKFSWQKMIPAVSAYLGANFNSSSSDFADQNNPNNRATKEQPSITPKVVIAAQNNWTKELVFVINFVADKITSEFPEYRFIATSTYSWKEKFSVFAEYEGVSSKIYKDYLLKVGGAYLFNEKFQIDAHVLRNIKDTPSRFVCNFGLSYRLDFHKTSDDEKIVTAEQRDIEKDIEQIKKDIADGFLDPSVMQGKYRGVDLTEYVEETETEGDFDSEYDAEKIETLSKKAKWWQLGKKRKQRKLLNKQLNDTTKTQVTVKPLQGSGGRMSDFVDEDYIKSKQSEITPEKLTPEQIAEIEERNAAKKKKRRNKGDDELLIDSVTGDTIPAPDYSGMSKKEIRRAKKEAKELKSLTEEIQNLESEIISEQSSREQKREAKRKEKEAKKLAKSKLKNKADLNEDYDDDFFNEPKKINEASESEPIDNDFLNKKEKSINSKKLKKETEALEKADKERAKREAEVLEKQLKEKAAQEKKKAKKKTEALEKADKERAKREAEALEKQLKEKAAQEKRKAKKETEALEKADKERAKREAEALEKQLKEKAEQEKKKAKKAVKAPKTKKTKKKSKFDNTNGIDTETW